VKKCTPIRTAPRDTTRRRELWETGRWVHARVATGRGREVVNVGVYYGIPGADSSSEAMQENERLLGLVFEEAALLAGAPTILLGNFNVPRPWRAGSGSTSTTLGPPVTGKPRSQLAFCVARAKGPAST
jgi:hypothetical protein